MKLREGREDIYGPRNDHPRSIDVARSERYKAVAACRVNKPARPGFNRANG